MATPTLNRSHWRKSSQWAMLLRPHAALAVNDTEVDRAFGRHCYTASNAQAWERFCPSDEHYFPTLLASKGLDGETDCSGAC